VLDEGLLAILSRSTPSSLHPSGAPLAQRITAVEQLYNLGVLDEEGLLAYLVAPRAHPPPSFPHPSPQALISAMEQLYNGVAQRRGAAHEWDARWRSFRLSLRSRKTLIASVVLGCSEEMLTIIAMLQV